MAFKEEGEVTYTMINGKKVPVVKCETEVVLRNTKTNVEYNSDKEEEDESTENNTGGATGERENESKEETTKNKED